MRAATFTGPWMRSSTALSTWSRGEATPSAKKWAHASIGTISRTNQSYQKRYYKRFESDRYLKTFSLWQRHWVWMHSPRKATDEIGGENVPSIPRNRGHRGACAQLEEVPTKRRCQGVRQWIWPASHQGWDHGRTGNQTFFEHSEKTQGQKKPNGSTYDPTRLQCGTEQMIFKEYFYLEMDQRQNRKNFLTLPYQTMNLKNS